MGKMTKPAILCSRSPERAGCTVKTINVLQHCLVHHSRQYRRQKDATRAEGAHENHPPPPTTCPYWVFSRRKIFCCQESPSFDRSRRERSDDTAFGVASTVIFEKMEFEKAKCDHAWGWYTPATTNAVSLYRSCCNPQPLRNHETTAQKSSFKPPAAELDNLIVKTTHTFSALTLPECSESLSAS